MFVFWLLVISTLIGLCRTDTKTGAETTITVRNVKRKRGPASTGADDDTSRIWAKKRREPNNVQCFKNSDCLSDCCISNSGWIGVCVGRPQVGQICGLFTSNARVDGNTLNYVGAIGNIIGVGYATQSRGSTGIAQAGMRVAASSNPGLAGMPSNSLLHNSMVSLQQQSQMGGYGYPQDPRIHAYQMAGGYGSPRGGSPNFAYYGLSNGKA